MTSRGTFLGQGQQVRFGDGGICQQGGNQGRPPVFGGEEIFDHRPGRLGIAQHGGTGGDIPAREGHAGLPAKNRVVGEKNQDLDGFRGRNGQSAMRGCAHGFRRNRGFPDQIEGLGQASILRQYREVEQQS